MQRNNREEAAELGPRKSFTAFPGRQGVRTSRSCRGKQLPITWNTLQAVGPALLKSEARPCYLACDAVIEQVGHLDVKI
jgi:hypothetical protein